MYYKFLRSNATITLFVIRRLFEILDKKQLFLAVIFSLILLPLIDAEASSNQNLFVSAENSQFENYF
jgi:hypothetical protein